MIAKVVSFESQGSPVLFNPSGCGETTTTPLLLPKRFHCWGNSSSSSSSRAPAPGLHHGAGALAQDDDARELRNRYVHVCRGGGEEGERVGGSWLGGYKGIVGREGREGGGTN